MDQQVAHNANTLLAFLVGRMNKHYLDVMQEELTDSEYKNSYKTLQKLLNDNNLPEAAGAVAAGTGIAKEEAGLSGEAGQQAIQALKQSGRLQQCGRGRGKCLVVLRTEPLPTEEGGEGEEQAKPQPVETNAEEEQEVVDANNIPALLRCVRDNYRDLERQLRESRRNEAHMSKLIDKLQQEINEKDEQISQLENAAQLKAVATWQ